MERLDREVKRAAKRAGLPAAGALVRIWPQLVGETIAANAWPARMSRKGVLQVNTSSAAWAFELKHLAPQILAKLASALAEDCPKELHFVVGPVPEKGSADAAATAPKELEISAEERRQGERLAEEIDNAELRALVARAAAASLAQKNKKGAP